MNILVITPHYWPEPFRVTDVVAGLKARGHRVVVLTALPNYPGGRFFEGYGLGGPYRELHEGGVVLRVPVVPRGAGGAIRLALNYVTFAMAGIIRALTLGNQRWDAIFVMQTSPVTAVLPAVVMRTFHGTPVVIWTQDLWPESVAAAGFGGSRLSYSLLRGMSGWIYRRCDRILAASRAFKLPLVGLGVHPDRFEYLPQWAEDLFTSAPESAVTPKLGLPTGFRILFAGNLGRVQSLDTLLTAAQMLSGDKEIRWVFMGDGAMSGWLREEVMRRELSHQVVVLGRRPVAEMPAFFAQADAMLVSLMANEAMALTVPAKVQAYLAAGRPVVGSLDGEGARIIEESGSGWAAPAGDATALAAIVARMKALSVDDREAMGRRGRAYSERFFSRASGLDHLCRVLEEAAAAAIR